LSRTKWTLIVSTLLLSAILVSGFRAVSAAEQFSVSATPGRVVEGYPVGIHLVLTVSNSQALPYAFTFSVTDPSGTAYTISKTQVSSGGTWSLTATFPTDFPSGATLNLVGTYTFNVGETAPTAVSSVGATTFEVALTDAQTYPRYSVVQVTGSGYLPLDPVTIRVAQGTTMAPGFPATKNATATGIFSFSWQTLPNTILGNYNVSLTGMNTLAKTPPDLQQITVSRTNTTTPVVQVNARTLLRTQTVQISFNATYLNGSPATTGSATLTLTEPGGTTSHIIIASYDSATKSFTAAHNTALNSTIGLWSASLNARAFDDGYGNMGPASPVTTTFYIQNAALTISDQPFNATYFSSSIIPIVAKITTPAGAIFTQGTVTASMSGGGRTVAGPISLFFDQTQGMWTGSYKVNSIDPSGTWLLTVSATDQFGNGGQTTASFNVNTPGPPAQNPQGLSTFTWLWLLTILGVLGLGFAILIFRRHNVSHREVKLDLHAIHSKAEEVKSDDFLQSIKTQLKRRADMMKTEKESAEKKHD
jgi:hypothetical protein